MKIYNMLLLDSMEKMRVSAFIFHDLIYKRIQTQQMIIQIA